MIIYTGCTCYAAVGHRKKLLKAIAMNNHTSTDSSSSAGMDLVEKSRTLVGNSEL